MRTIASPEPVLGATQAGSPSLAPSRSGRVLFAVACLLLLVASLRNIDAPWELGMRGANGARYSHVTVFHTVHFGLGVTLGTPAFVTEIDGEPVRAINWHHPPIYWLYLSAFGWLFGITPLVLRAAHLLLWLPALLAVFLLVRRRCGELVGATVALLFATAPLLAYYGPMVIQDGAALSSGLVTVCCFLRYLDQPSRRRWWATAATFFLTCSVDFPGYWWGPALFVLALLHERRRLAVRTVLTLFPVSVLAFAAMALHYGLALGGPLAYLRELFTPFVTKPDTPAASVSMARFGGAMQDLWIVHGNQVLGGLALFGLLLIPLARDQGERRLAALGAALLVPGILNYAMVFGHGVDHVFWSMHGFVGLCALAAIGPTFGLRLLRQRGWRAVSGGTFVLAAAATAGWGTVATHRVITMFAFEDRNDTPFWINRALPFLEGCSTTLTSAAATPQGLYGHTSLFFGIDTADKLRTLLAFAKANGLRGKVGFVVHPQHRDSDLPPLLDTLAPRRDVDGMLVYHVPL